MVEISILITGGAGYIGSHTSVELIKNGYNCVIYDNLSNSRVEVIKSIEKITEKGIKFVNGDLLDKENLRKIFSENEITLVVHFAGLKSVKESVENPLDYYRVNVEGTINLLHEMYNANVKKLVFSSSATVYGEMSKPPFNEDSPRSCNNTYARTKLMVEEILNDLSISDPEWCFAVLRYFNPVGAHESGLIGENPSGIPNNIMPSISQVAIGQLERVNIFGFDYSTLDGTGIRDYIHVSDLAEGHVKAIDYISLNNGYHPFNLGTGIGYSVLDLLTTFEQINKVNIPYQLMNRRPGDVPVSFANVSKAKTKLGWQATRDLESMCEDTWRWQKNILKVNNETNI